MYYIKFKNYVTLMSEMCSSSKTKKSSTDLE